MIEADMETAVAIRAALYRAVPDMPSYAVGIIEPYLVRHRQQAEDAMRERCARVCEEFPLAEDHPDAGVLGCRDMEIATAIRNIDARAKGEGA